MPSFLTHVHGPCSLAMRKGPAGGFEQVGLSTDGFSIDFTVHDEPIMTDAAGRRVPADLQEMGMDATIRGRLVVYDDDLLSKYCLKLTDAINEGEMPTIGLPIGQSGNQVGVLMVSEQDDPWRFFCTRIRAGQTKLSTSHTVWDLNIYAWALVGNSFSAKGKKLFDRSLT